MTRGAASFPQVGQDRGGDSETAGRLEVRGLRHPVGHHEARDGGAAEHPHRRSGRCRAP